MTEDEIAALCGGTRAARRMEQKRSNKAIRACAEWLAYCLKIGWKREQLDELERLWWMHHS
jgi:hypothetical protein